VRNIRSLDRECLLKLWKTIPEDDYPRRTDFLDTIVNNENLHTKLPDGRIAVYIAGDDLAKVNDLEREAGFTCQPVSTKE